MLKATATCPLTKRLLLTLSFALSAVILAACQPSREVAEAPSDIAEIASAATAEASSATDEETGAPLPFSMPVPGGWRTETIPFPLSFAPDLPYEGVEELRFAPGMFEANNETFWSYSFVWWIRDQDPTDAASLSVHLQAYFRGLAAGVANVEQATFEVALEESGDNGVVGTANILDSFSTHQQVRLNVHIQRLPCSTVGRQLVFFALSPQSRDHSVWEELGTIRTGVECLAQPGG